MARTKIETKKYVDNVETGTTVGVQKPSKPGEKMKIFIPKLMVNIKQTSPSGTDKVITKGNMMFANDDSCKPNAPMVINTQSYITPPMVGGSWEGKVEDIEKDSIQPGTEVQLTFPSGNIENVSFSPK